jgi:hypothetical protein
MSPPPLSMFTRAMLEEYKFPGTDAAVTFIPEGQKPVPEVQQVLTRAGQARWYPVEGGHRAKIPWHFAEGHESLFEREEKGWDHEHCDFCNAHVNIGELCWTAETGRGDFWLFCRSCQEKVKEK